MRTTALACSENTRFLNGRQILVGTSFPRGVRHNHRALADRFHQLAGLHIQCVCQFHNIEQAHVPLTALYTANIVTMQVCKLGQLFLRQIPLLSKGSQRFAEYDSWVGAWHLARQNRTAKRHSLCAITSRDLRGATAIVDTNGELEQLHIECVRALRSYMMEANETCKLLTQIKNFPVSVNQRVAILEQRRTENLASDKYQEARRKLFKAANWERS